MTVFSERLSQLRKSNKITQKALAEQLDVSVRIVQAYEYGEKRPEIEGIIKIANFFGVSVDYLVGKEDLPHSSNRFERSVKPEEAEFLKWVEDNVSDVFFYEFDRSPEESKEQLMKDLRYMWEREKKSREHKKGG